MLKVARLILCNYVSGTRIGQASECFVYWKDTVTNDTWGLNFTSPIDAKQFRECCVSLVILHPRHACRYIIRTSCHNPVRYHSHEVSAYFLSPIGSRARKLSGDDLGATHNKSDTSPIRLLRSFAVTS